MFGRCCVINLDRRPERLRAFHTRLPADWPFGTVYRVAAFDGAGMTPPPWYGGKHRLTLRGAWGCFCSHLSNWKTAIADDLDSVLILEDDCVFAPDFPARARQFVDAVPDDWDMIYFGGQHLNHDTIPPVRVNEHVIRGRNVNRTHAYAIRRDMMQRCVDELGKPWPQQMPVNRYNFDFRLGQLQEGRNVYCPTQWLCGQAAGTSDVYTEGRFLSTVWWREFPIVEQEAAPC